MRIPYLQISLKKEAKMFDRHKKYLGKRGYFMPPIPKAWLH